MLNPSTADADRDDPTIRRCIGFAQAWQCGTLIVTNLFAYRATSPFSMKTANDPVGRENAEHVQRAAEEAYNIDAAEFGEEHGLVICAWGEHGKFMDQDLATLGWIDHYRPQALRVLLSGQPAHPLYLPKTASPFLYKGRDAR